MLFITQRRYFGPRTTFEVLVRRVSFFWRARNLCSSYILKKSFVFGFLFCFLNTEIIFTLNRINIYVKINKENFEVRNTKDADWLVTHTHIEIPSRLSCILLPIRARITRWVGEADQCYSSVIAVRKCGELELSGAFIIFGLQEDSRPLQTFRRHGVFNLMLLRIT